MEFNFGQSEQIGRVTKKDIKKSTDVIIIQYNLIEGQLASIHKAGCRDIKKDVQSHLGSFGGRYIDTKSALESYIDAEICKLGYGEGYSWTEVIRVLPCAMDRSYMDGYKKEPTYAVGM